MNKAREEIDIEPDVEKLDCVHHEACGNETPGPKNPICDECLDLARRNDYEGRVERSDFEDMTAFMEELYNEYDD